MKNESESAVRGNEPAGTSQPKTNAPRKKAANGNHTGGVVTCVLIEPNGREWARVEFSRDVWARIEAAARQRHISLGKFFLIAIRHYIKFLTGRRSA